MKQTMDLKAMGLIEIETAESQEIMGGNVFESIGWFIGATAHFVVYALKDAVQNPIRPSTYR